jgi:hypothetical protein
MIIRTVYCSACDKEVQVVMTDDVDHSPQANVADPELVCLEIGENCTGNLCPLGAAEPNAMIGRLVRSGLPLDNLRQVRGWCDDCGRETDLALYGTDLAACTVCGRSRKRPGAGTS